MDATPLLPQWAKRIKQEWIWQLYENDTHGLPDKELYGFHWNAVTGPRRATGVNLIEGNYHQVVEFLNRLTYGEGSTHGVREGYAERQSKLAFAAGK